MCSMVFECLYIILHSATFAFAFIAWTDGIDVSCKSWSYRYG